MESVFSILSLGSYPVGGIDILDLPTLCEKYREKYKIKGMFHTENLHVSASNERWTQRAVNDCKVEPLNKSSVFQGENSVFSDRTESVKTTEITINKGVVKGIYNTLTIPFSGALAGKIGSYIKIDPGRKHYRHTDTVFINFILKHSGYGSNWIRTFHQESFRYDFECTVTLEGRVILGEEEQTVARIVQETVEPSVLRQFTDYSETALSWKMRGTYLYSYKETPVFGFI